MATNIEYALMAGASYISTRPDANKFPVPVGWTERIEKREIDPASGFEATYFTDGTEIVISFAGTGPGSPLSADWVHGNIPLANGILSDQLRQAADYYLAVKAAAPAGTTINQRGQARIDFWAECLLFLSGNIRFGSIQRAVPPVPTFLLSPL